MFSNHKNTHLKPNFILFFYFFLFFMKKEKNKKIVFSDTSIESRKHNFFFEIEYFKKIFLNVL